MSENSTESAAVDLMEDVVGHEEETACPSPELPAYDRRAALNLAAIGLTGRTEAAECEAGGHWHVSGSE